MKTIQQLEREGYTGTDADLATSIIEYHLAWKRNKADNGYTFVYGSDYNEQGEAIRVLFGEFLDSDMDLFEDLEITIEYNDRYDFPHEYIPHLVVEALHEVSHEEIFGIAYHKGTRIVENEITVYSFKHKQKTSDYVVKIDDYFYFMGTGTNGYIPHEFTVPEGYKELKTIPGKLSDMIIERCKELEWNEPQPFNNLDQMIRCEAFQSWDSDNRNSLGYNDKERAERCYKASEHGSDGSTHQEIIEDWREFLNDQDIYEPLQERIEKEIDSCEQWHIDNGSINDQLS